MITGAVPWAGKLLYSIIKVPLFIDFYPKIMVIEVIVA